MADNEKTDKEIEKEIAKGLINDLSKLEERINDYLSLYCDLKYVDKRITSVFPDAENWIKEILSDKRTVYENIYLYLIVSTLADNGTDLKQYIEDISFTGTLPEFLYIPIKENETRYTNWLYHIDRNAYNMLFQLSDILTFEGKHEPGNTYDSYGGKRTDNVIFPLDKANQKIYNLSDKQNRPGAITQIDVTPTKTKEKKNTPVLYEPWTIDFSVINDELPEAKRLDPFDSIVYIAANALWYIGNDVISDSQIYSLLKGGKNIGTDAKEKIRKSMRKFHAVATLSNKLEVENHFKYTQRSINGPLLPFYEETTTINGQLTEVSYHISLDRNKFTYFPLIQFAEDKHQNAVIPAQVMQIPGNLTDRNILTNNYLIWRIEQIKRGRERYDKILWQKIYDNSKTAADKEKGLKPDSERKLNQRIKKEALKILDNFKECGYIKGYTEDKTGINIEVDKIKDGEKTIEKVSQKNQKTIEKVSQKNQKTIEKVSQSKTAKH